MRCVCPPPPPPPPKKKKKKKKKKNVSTKCVCVTDKKKKNVKSSFIPSVSPLPGPQLSATEESQLFAIAAYCSGGAVPMTARNIAPASGSCAQRPGRPARSLTRAALSPVFTHSVRCDQSSASRSAQKTTPAHTEWGASWRRGCPQRHQSETSRRRFRNDADARQGPQQPI